MNRAFACTIVAAVIAMAAGTGPTHPAGSGDGARDCLKRAATSGRPHRIRSVAELNAVRAWTQLVQKHGQAYAMWHNAGGLSMECEKLGGSDYYQCVAAGKPCRAGGEARAASR